MKILLIAGGWSSERDVSLNGASEIRSALAKSGHETTLADPLTDLDQIVNAGGKFDFAFINMHGAPGEDGFIQAILETVRLPFNGSGSAASAIALNKYCAKKFFAKAGLNVLPDCLFTEKNLDAQAQGITFPAIFKPNKGGSSIFLRKQESQEDFSETARQIIEERKDEFLLESMLAGTEVSCPVLGNSGDSLSALPLILIRPKNRDLFDYYAKYNAEGADEICPAPVSGEMAARIAKMAMTAHQCLGLDGYSRSDFIIPESGEPAILEINTLPGMTPNSLLPKSARVYGLSFEELIFKIIELGLKRFNNNRQHA